MKLKYVGSISPIPIIGIKNPDGGMGISVKSGDVFECSAEIASKLMANAKDKFKEVTGSLLDPPKEKLLDPPAEKMVKGYKNK